MMISDSLDRPEQKYPVNCPPLLPSWGGVCYYGHRVLTTNLAVANRMQNPKITYSTNRSEETTEGRNWPMQEWFKVKQASKYCGLSEATLRKLLKEGLPHSRIRRTILIKREWMDEYFKSFKVEHNQVDEMVDDILGDFKE